jgi:hypothetical protein
MCGWVKEKRGSERPRVLLSSRSMMRRVIDVDLAKPCKINGAAHGFSTMPYLQVKPSRCLLESLRAVPTVVHTALGNSTRKDIERAKTAQGISRIRNAPTWAYSIVSHIQFMGI